MGPEVNDATQTGKLLSRDDNQSGFNKSKSVVEANSQSQIEVAGSNSVQFSSGAYFGDESSSESSFSFQTPPNHSKYLRMLYAGEGHLISDETRRVDRSELMAFVDSNINLAITSTPKSSKNKNQMKKQLKF